MTLPRKRVDAEESRVDAEESRVDAEESRVDAEESFDAAEEERISSQAGVVYKFPFCTRPFRFRRRFPFP